MSNELFMLFKLKKVLFDYDSNNRLLNKQNVLKIVINKSGVTRGARKVACFP